MKYLEKSKRKDGTLMKITYIFHSSFCIELDQSVLIFDYYKGTIPQFPSEKKIYVFASHKHYDHFDLAIFSLASLYPNIQFILSNDLKMNENYLTRMEIPEEVWDKIIYVKKNDNLGLSEDFKVETLRSTDAGVAFIVTTEGKSIYHAGDLNWWTWNGETQEEYEAMTKQFQEEIHRIENRYFDVAFLPLDPRQEDKYYLGFDYFMKHTNAKYAIAMHFWEQPEVIDRIKQEPEARSYQERIIPLKKEGDSYEI